jgi:tricorn protease-like protein
MLLYLSTAIAACLARQSSDAAPRPYGEIVQSALEHVSSGAVDAARAELDRAELSSRGFEWMHVNLAVELARANGAGPGLGGRSEAARTNPAPRIEAVAKLYGHTAKCRALAISPGGDRVASGGAEHDIHLWNARTGDPERRLSGHTGSIVGLVFSKDGRRLASGSTDGNAILWDVFDGRAAMTLRATGEALTAIAWSANDDWIATADTTLGLRVFSAASSEARFVVRGHTKPITSVAFSSDGKYVASASEDGSVRVVQAQSGELARVFAGNGTPVCAVAFEADGLRLRVSTADGSVRRLDLSSGARIDASLPVGEPFWCLAPSADATRFATGSELGFVRIFDASSNRVFASQVSLGPIFALAFDSKTSRLFACGDEGVIFVLETDAALARALQRANPSALPDDETAAGMKPLEIDALCRRVVGRPGLAAETYVRAEALARAAAERAPALGQIQSTIAAAVYRQERHAEALALLSEAAVAKRGWPLNLAFRAMALARLERLDQAREVLERLEILLCEKRFENAVEERALLEEARTVVASR